MSGGTSLTFVVKLCNDDTTTDRSTTISFLLSTDYYTGITVTQNQGSTYTISSGLWATGTVVKNTCIQLTITATVATTAAGSYITNKAQVVFSDPDVQEISASTIVSVPSAVWYATCESVSVASAYSFNEDTSQGPTQLVWTTTSTEPNLRNAVISVAPTKGTVTIDSTGKFTYTPTGNYYGADSFQFKYCLIANPLDCGKVAPSMTTEAECTVNLQVANVYDAPVAVADTRVLTENSIESLTLFTNDYDYDNGGIVPGPIRSAVYQLVIVTNPTWGGAVVTDAPQGLVSYTPNAGYYGPDSFTYKICDIDTGSKCSNTVTVTLSALTPDSNDDSAGTGKNAAISIQVWANDNNNDATPRLNNFLVSEWLPIVTTIDQAGATAVVSTTTGRVTYTPATDYLGTTTFKYKICRTTTLDRCSSEATVTVTVADLLAVADTTTKVQNDGAKTIDVLANDPYSPLTLADVTLVVNTHPPKGTVTVDVGPVFKYTNLDTYSGVDTFSYQWCK